MPITLPCSRSMLRTRNLPCRNSYCAVQTVREVRLPSTLHSHSTGLVLHRRSHLYLELSLSIIHLSHAKDHIWTQIWQCPKLSYLLVVTYIHAPTLGYDGFPRRCWRQGELARAPRNRAVCWTSCWDSRRLDRSVLASPVPPLTLSRTRRSFFLSHILSLSSLSLDSRPLALSLSLLSPAHRTHSHALAHTRAGLEWDDQARGRHNGSKDGVQYFAYVTHDAVRVAWIHMRANLIDSPPLIAGCLWLQRA